MEVQPALLMCSALASSESFFELSGIGSYLAAADPGLFSQRPPLQQPSATKALPHKLNTQPRDSIQFLK